MVAVVTRPFRADLAAGEADIAVRARDGHRALAHATRATRLAPWEPRYWFFRAAANEILGDLAAARRAAEEAARIQRGSPRYAELAAKLAWKAGDAEEASRWYREAVGRDPYGTSVLMSAAAFELERGRSADSVGYAKRAIAIRPDLTDAWRTLARASQAWGDLAGARSAYERVLALHPGDVEAVAFLADRRVSGSG